MKKICPRCKQEQKDPQHVGCDSCGVPYVDESDLVGTFTNEELKRIASYILKDWRVYVVAGFVLIVGVFALDWQVGRKIAAQVDTLQKNASNLIASASSAITTQIVAEFQTPRIKQTVESVAKVEAVEILRNEVRPVVEGFRGGVENKLSTLDEAIKRGNTAVAELQAYTIFNNTVLAAQNDDRKAFDQLWTWSQDKNYTFSKAAGEAWVTILDNHASPISYSGFAVPWNEGVDPSKLSLGQLCAGFASAPSHVRLGLTEYIWARKDFPMTDRMQFLVDVMQKDPSLKVVEYAARFFANESKDQLKPLAIKQHLEWWERNKASIK